MDTDPPRFPVLGRRRLLTSGLAAGAVLPCLTPGRADAAVTASAAPTGQGYVIYFCQNDGVRISGPAGNDAFLTNGIINTGQSHSGAAVHIQNFVHGAVNISDADILQGQYSMLVDNAIGLRFQNTYFDSSANGVELRNNATQITFSNCWFSNRPGPGLTIRDARGVTVSGGQAANCGGHGILITDGAKYVSLMGVQAMENNGANSGADGIRVAGQGVDYVSIVGCQCGNDVGISSVFANVGQRAGIHVTQAVQHSHYTISHNVLFGNPDGGIIDRGTGEKNVTGNVGDHGM